MMSRSEFEPYAAPRSAGRAIEVGPQVARQLVVAGLLVLAPVGAIAALIGLAVAGTEPSGATASLPLALTALSALCGAVLAGRTFRQLTRISPLVRPAGRWAAALLVPLGSLTFAISALAAMAVSSSFGRGRQLRRFFRMRLAPVEPLATWLSPPRDSTTLPDRGPELDRAAAAWRRNGLTEHASVAAFAHLSAELLALGAPPELLEDAHADALDELRHTRLCFSLARELDGRAEGPAAFPLARAIPRQRGTRGTALAALAVSSLIDGALNEGVSARVVAELAKDSAVGSESARRVLATIARDEARHAAHAWRVAAWCLAAGGPVVAAALAGAMSGLGPELGASLSPEAADGRLERFGIPGRAREQRAYTEVRARVLARAERLLAVGRAAA
jgi:hypothetical protein